MEAPYILISTISPERDKRIDEFDKHSKYIVRAEMEAEYRAEMKAEYYAEMMAEQDCY